jgi:hypothetical protein
VEHHVGADAEGGHPVDALAGHCPGLVRGVVLGLPPARVRRDRRTVAEVDAAEGRSRARPFDLDVPRWEPEARRHLDASAVRTADDATLAVTGEHEMQEVGPCAQ